MSIRIDIIKMLSDMMDSSFDIEVSTDEALAILKQNFKENVEAGAPLSLIEEHLMAINKTVDEIRDIYTANVLKLK